MKRLTDRDENGEVFIKDMDTTDLFSHLNYPEFETLLAAVERLADYEDSKLEPKIFRKCGSACYIDASSFINNNISDNCANFEVSVIDDKICVRRTKEVNEALVLLFECDT